MKMSTVATADELYNEKMSDKNLRKAETVLFKIISRRIKAATRKGYFSVNVRFSSFFSI